MVLAYFGLSLFFQENLKETFPLPMKQFIRKVTGPGWFNVSHLKVCNMIIQVNYKQLFQAWKYSQMKKAFIRKRIFHILHFIS
jgi:hypothetical protein